METGWWWGGRRRTFQLQRAARPKAQHLGDMGAAWLQLRQVLREALSSAWTHRLPSPTPEEAHLLCGQPAALLVGVVASPAPLEPQRTEPRASAGNSDGGAECVCRGTPPRPNCPKWHQSLNPGASSVANQPEPGLPGGSENGKTLRFILPELIGLVLNSLLMAKPKGHRHLVAKKVS